ncbi:GAF and ANTAR domain-containing protein [Thermomonospora umbrina]|uniref:GAF and ANTAR domain-containing protein n=1 Tax=Thermomonospora umbrina TaxID=111806 RepID=UPI001FE6EE7A|nr:GAF and ANTAR domain-containing protein [Thermomonospora umbrina]
MGETFVEIADTLVARFDVIDLLHFLSERCVQLLDVDAAGVLLADERGTLSLAAASTEQARMLELFQLQDEEGPCLDCFHSGVRVSCGDLGLEPQRWPRFTEAARERGFAAVTAVPLRLGEARLGAMNLFRVTTGSLGPEALLVAQALADMATIGIVNERAHGRAELVVEQLQGALNSRTVIEQAKGVLAERGRISVSDAFTVLRSYARDHNRLLSQVAHAVVEQSPDVADLLGTTTPPRP